MIDIQFETLSKYERLGEYVQVAVPFPAGTLREPDTVVVRDGQRLCPVQSRVTARWPDGSVRWLLVRFLVDLPANAPKTCVIDVAAAPGPAPAEPVRIAASGRGKRDVTTGPLAVQLGGPGEPLLTRCGRDGEEAGLDRPAELAIHCGGRPAQARVGAAGWQVVEGGPVFAEVRTEGQHIDPEGRGLLDFALGLRFFAGKPWIQAEYRVLNREDGEWLEIDDVTWSFFFSGEKLDQVRTALGESNYRTAIQCGEQGAPIYKLIDSDHLIYQANEQIPETHYGTFWADWAGPGGGLCVTQHQAHQNFPKAFRVDGNTLRAEIVPPQAGGLRLARGMAKTHRLQLHFHGPDESIDLLDARTLQYQMPDVPLVSPHAFRQADVFPGIWVDKPIGRVERVLLDLADQRTFAYGMLHWGDGPDRGYTSQGRGAGKLVWTNNEYDVPHAAMQLFARTGERRFLDYLFVTAEHQMNIDVCHLSDDPLRHGGQVIHSADHVTLGCSPCHEWVEGLIDYYHQTGDRFAWATAVGIGQNVLRHLEKPQLRQPAGAATRVTGWALRTLVALYRETGETCWKDPADRIANQFAEWYQRYGGWVAPYTSHTLVRVPFMMAIAACSCMRYWRVTGDEKVKELIIAAMRDMVDHCLMPDGRFYYKELPSLQRRGAGTYVLEALACAWELSGDEAFLEAGMVTFEESLASAVSDKGEWNGEKFEADGGVVVPRGAGPKAFGATFMPLMAFYRAVVETGRIDH